MSSRLCYLCGSHSDPNHILFFGTLPNWARHDSATFHWMQIVLNLPKIKSQNSAKICQNNPDEAEKAYNVGSKRINRSSPRMVVLSPTLAKRNLHIRFPELVSSVSLLAAEDIDVGMPKKSAAQKQWSWRWSVDVGRFEVNESTNWGAYPGNNWEMIGDESCGSYD